MVHRHLIPRHLKMIQRGEKFVGEVAESMPPAKQLVVKRVVLMGEMAVVDEVASKVAVVGKVMDKIVDEVVYKVVDEVVDKVVDEVVDEVVGEVVDKVVGEVVGKILGKVVAGMLLGLAVIMKKNLLGMLYHTADTNNLFTSVLYVLLPMCMLNQLCRTDESDEDQLKWTLGPLLTSAAKQPPPRELAPFTYPQGPSPRTKSATKPLQVLQLYLTTVILDSIVQQTKLFASQKGKTIEFCVEELMAFIGISIAMGMLHLPRLKDYWSTNTIHTINTMVSICDVKRSFFSDIEISSFSIFQPTKKERRGRVRSFVQTQTTNRSFECSLSRVL